MSRTQLISTYRGSIVAVVLACGLAVTVAVWRSARTGEEERLEIDFRRRSEVQARLARERLAVYQEMVRGLGSYFANQTEVTRAEFRRVAQELLARHAAIKALQWVPLVPAASRTAVERAVREELDRPFEFRIRQTDDTLVTAPPKDFYWPILFVEPLDGNQVVLGYDITTAPTAGQLALARESRSLVVTHQFHLAQSRGPDDESGVVFAVPVFAPEPAGRPAAFRGFVQCVFQVRTMLGHVFRENPDEALQLYYVDLDAPDDASRLLYANLAGHEPPAATTVAVPRGDAAVYRETIEVGNRRWQLISARNAGWEERQRTAIPGLILVGGVLATVLGGLFVNMLLQRTYVVESEVAERTAELLTARRLLEEDVRQREATELRLRESESRLQAILENSPSAIFVKDLQGRYVLFNRPFEALCRRSVDQIIGRRDHEMFPPEVADRLRRDDEAVIAAGTACEFEETIAHPDGARIGIVQKFPLRDATGGIYALGGIVTDITERTRNEAERRELERRMQASQKLESLGVLAGGIAHDFNNILTAVLGNASLARQIAGSGSKVDPQLGQIENAARRAADLCQQMLAYAGRGQLASDRVDLSDIVQGTTALLEVTISKNTTLELDLDRHLPVVVGDPTQLRQIVMNLVINAADAIGERPGRITIRTFSREADPAMLAGGIGHPELKGGTYAGIEVADNGCGMTPGTIARIFEPFFTTKFSGRGLGLSAVLGIVQSHHGALFVDSAPGRGSTFRLMLPAAPGLSRAQPAAAGIPTAATLRGTVLVVDDEEAVREIARAALESFGLEVIVAESGEKAVGFCQSMRDRIDLVLLDLTMPGISGEETVRRLRLVNSRAKVILMSGFSESDSTLRLGNLGVAGFLQKPFELKSLLEKIGPLLG